MRIETGYVILYLTDRWSVGKERKKMRTVKDAKERRNEILDAAEVLFVSKGYDNTTMKDILEKVQIAKGTLYYHFKSKEDILDAMVERIEERMKEKVKRVINTKKPVLTRVTDAILAMHVSSDIELAMLEEMHKPQNALLHQKSQEETMKWIVPMMETLADKGNGNYAYIDCLREANKVLVEEMSATLLTICKDVKLQVEFNPAVVESYRLLGYENRALAKEDFNDDTKDAGEIGAGHSVTALYEIVLKEPLDGSMSEEEINQLKYSDEYKKEYGEEKITSRAAMKEWLTISIRYKKPSEKESNLLEYPVGYECYTNKPSDDFIFAAAVAEFGLLASHSAYPEDASVKHVEKALNSIRLNDEYKEEFLELVEETEL